MTGLTFLADGELDEAEAFAIEGAHRLKIHLVVGDLQYLVLEADGVAGRPDLEAARRPRKRGVIGIRTGVMAGIGPCERNRWGRRQRQVEFGSTRSRGRKSGVSELATLSASTRWCSWCHCIRVRSMEKIGMSEMAMVGFRRLKLRMLWEVEGTRQILPSVWLMVG
jgi:hypothetical protein